MSIESRSNQYGSVFGNWQIKNILGQGSGGKSAVFKLSRNDSDWEEECALKVINLIEERGDLEAISDYRKDEYITARDACSKNAVQEVRLMATLRGNTNIVDYLDYKFSDWQSDSAFGRDMLIRMELLHDLRSELKNGRMFSEAEIIKLGRDICAALVLCHGKDIWHRDIKPENIFVNEDGNYKLGDFGISKIMSATPTAMASTGVCTPEYAAPEQLSGKHDKRVDIYSLGLVLYELSNQNRLPFASNSYVRQEEVQKRHMGTALPNPSNASSALTQVILKACAFKPKNRYQTAKEFLDALEVLQAKEQKKSKKITGIVLNCDTFSNEEYDIHTAQNVGHYICLSGNELTYGNTIAPILRGMEFPDGFFDKNKKRISRRQYDRVLAEIGALELPESQSDEEVPAGDGAVKRGIEITYSTGEVYKYTTTGLISPPVLKIAELLGGLCRFRRLPPNWGKLQSDVENLTDTLDQVDRYQTVPTADPYSTMPAKSHDTHDSEKNKRTMRKGGIIISIVALLLVLVLLIHSCSGNGTTGESTGMQQVDWSDWQDQLPDYVTDEDYEIEEQEVWRSITVVDTTSSTTQSTMDGWEMYYEAKAETPGAWSQWSPNKEEDKEGREFEQKQCYSFCDKETTTATTSTLSGWTYDKTTYTWGTYPNTYKRADQEPEQIVGREIVPKTIWEYRDKQTTTSTSKTLDGWTMDESKGIVQNWGASQTTTAEPQTGDGLRITATTQTGWGYYHYCNYYSGCWNVDSIPYGSGNHYHACTTNSAIPASYIPDQGGQQTYGGTGSGAPACGYNLYYWFRNPSADTYTYTYQTCTPEYHFYKWTGWKESESEITAIPGEREVRPKTVYYYRDRERVPVYHFWRYTGNWSTWDPAPQTKTETRDVQQKLCYRYRDKLAETTYYFRKWSNWEESEWTTNEIIESDTVKVQKKTQYKFKSKAD